MTINLMSWRRRLNRPEEMLPVIVRYRAVRRLPQNKELGIVTSSPSLVSIRSRFRYSFLWDYQISSVSCWATKHSLYPLDKESGHCLLPSSISQQTGGSSECIRRDGRFKGSFAALRLLYNLLAISLLHCIPTSCFYDPDNRPTSCSH